MVRSRNEKRHAISRMVTSGIIVVIIVAAGLIAVFSFYAPSIQSTSSTSAFTSSSTTPSPILSSATSSSSSSSASTTSSPTSAAPTTLVMDDANFPYPDLNVLYFVYELPWPDWWEFSVYQPLVAANLTAEYQQGVIQDIPALASNWTVSSDAMTYTFNLRHGINFSNGDPFNAYQVWGELYGLYYLSANSSGWFQSYTIYDMSHVDFGPSTIALMQQSGLAHPNSQLMSIMTNSSWPIYVTGPYQIVFHLKAPFLWFLGTLVSYMGMTFDTQFVLDHGGFGTPATLNPYFNTNPIPGTGPYTITGVAVNSYVTFAQNPSYWGKNLTPSQIAANPILDPGHVAKVIIYDKPDDIARYTDLSTGTAQIATIQSTDWNLVQANPNKYSYTSLPAAGVVDAVALNTNEYPTNVTAVRQAIVHAINYTDVREKAFFGQITPGMGPEYPSWKNFYDLGNYPPYQYNITLAKQYLQQAGINASNLPTLTFRTVSGCDYCNTAAQVIQGDLANIGLTVNIAVVSSNEYGSVYGSYSTNVQNAQQLGQLSFLGEEIWAPSALTPADNWVSFVSNTSSWGNWAGYYNPKVQACVDAFTNSSSLSAIQGICRTAQTQVYNDAPYAWIGFCKLFDGGGSLVWRKGIVKSFYLDPAFGGMSTMPIINTVTFG